jgi:hypothetical protein
MKTLKNKIRGPILPDFMNYHKDKISKAIAAI